jgi:hypothetical protein
MLAVRADQPPGAAALSSTRSPVASSHQVSTGVSTCLRTATACGMV